MERIIQTNDGDSLANDATVIADMFLQSAISAVHANFGKDFVNDNKETKIISEYIKACALVHVGTLLTKALEDLSRNEGEHDIK